jgi:hypothetical protein
MCIGKYGMLHFMLTDCYSPVVFQILFSCNWNFTEQIGSNSTASD